MRVIDRSGESFTIQFQRDDKKFAVILNAVRDLPGAKFDQSTMKWVVPSTSTAQVAIFARDHGFQVTPEAVSLGKSVRDTMNKSRASEADFDVPGLGGTLRPFQRAGVQYALNAKRCIIADEMGLGKTIEALATVQAANAFPCVVVCPATLKLNWRREAVKWLPGRTVQILSGQTTEVTDADVVIVNYDILNNHMATLSSRKFQAAILDESHYIKNPKAKRSRLALQLLRGKRARGGKLQHGAREIPLRLLLTGTPILNRPNELIYQLTAIDRLGDLGGFWTFADRYCNAYKMPGGNWNLLGSKNLDELNTRLRAVCFVRRRKADVLKELPAKVRAVVPVDLDNRTEYEHARREFEEWLASIGKSDIEITAALRAEQLTRIAYLKKLAAIGKLPAVKAWVSTFLDSGEKLVVFAHHRSIVHQLAKEFGAPCITGATSMKERDEVVQRFQTDPSCQLLVANMAAGGLGITLTAASNVAFVELGWTPALHAQAEDRCHRIGQSDSVTAWYLLSDDTVDVTIYRLLAHKTSVVNTATDGVGKSGSTSVFPDLMAAMRSGAVPKLNGEPSTWAVDEERDSIPDTPLDTPVDTKKGERPLEKGSARAKTPLFRNDGATSQSLTAQRDREGEKAVPPPDTDPPTQSIESIMTSTNVAKSLVLLYEAQTQDEKEGEVTTHDNGVGFSGSDAGFGSSLARQLLAGRVLTPKQETAARRMLKKYMNTQLRHLCVGQ